MARRNTKHHGWADEPGRLLGHDDPYDIWSKLHWETNQFLAMRRAEPPLDLDGMVYLLQDACISAVAVVEWLKIAVARAARNEKRKFDDAAFEQAVDQSLPHIKLARAISNTFKHGTYRDEGWGDAEFRLDVLFTPIQHERLRALRGTEKFEEAYAEEAAEADFKVTFIREDKHGSVDAASFVEGLSSGALRLLDDSQGEFEAYFEPAAR